MLVPVNGGVYRESVTSLLIHTMCSMIFEVRDDRDTGLSIILWVGAVSFVKITVIIVSSHCWKS